MAPKRKFSEADLEPAVPPSLPPSVEEAYRRKCVQLKNRTNEVEDANDAARLRLARIKRQVEKLRIERAFLLEQLAKRTSTNVEDSEGSPSPPPMENHIDILPAEPDAHSRKIKDKPLRTKRGGRKSAAADGELKPTTGSAKEPRSPNSEASQQPDSGAKDTKPNGVSENDQGKGMSNGFDLFCMDARAVLEAKNEDGDMNIDEELARMWEEMPEIEKEEYQAAFEQDSYKETEVKDAESPKKDDAKSEADKGEAHDDDVEMVNYDTEDQEAQMDKDGEE